MSLRIVSRCTKKQAHNKKQCGFVRHAWMVYVKECVYIGNPNQTRHLGDHHRRIKVLVREPHTLLVLLRGENVCSLLPQYLHTAGVESRDGTPILRDPRIRKPWADCVQNQLLLHEDSNDFVDKKRAVFSGRGFLGLPQKGMSSHWFFRSPVPFIITSVPSEGEETRLNVAYRFGPSPSWPVAVLFQGQVSNY